MNITFYVLLNDVGGVFNDTANTKTHKEADVSASLLDFVCELTQTILEKSDKQLIIIDDSKPRIQSLDKKLWEFSHTSFIAHDVCFLDNSNNGDVNTIDSNPVPNIKTITVADSKAPVVIVDRLPDQFAYSFDGIILNLSSKPLSLTATEENTFTQLDRLLEIIPADMSNKEKGRKKYAHYKEQGHTFTLHNINNG